MEYRPPWTSKYSQAKEFIPVNQPKMSLLAMTAPGPHAGFKREYPWDKRSDCSRPRTEPERFSLPSIRQVLFIRLVVYREGELTRAPGVPRAASAHTAGGPNKTSINCFANYRARRCHHTSGLHPLAEPEQATAVFPRRESGCGASKPASKTANQPRGDAWPLPYSDSRIRGCR